LARVLYEAGEVGLHQVEHQVQVLERRQLAWGEEGGGRAAR
jgi:hypothetical protein